MRIGVGISVAAISEGLVAPQPGPVVTIAPVISGSPALGNMLTVSDGSWTGTGPITFTYQWLRGGVPIAGQSGAQYTVDASDQGGVLSCMVSATDSAGTRGAMAAGVSVPAAAQIVRYHVVGGFGQSNLHGAAVPSVYDPQIDLTDPRILLLKDNVGQGDHDTLVVAADPLCADAEGTPPNVGLMLPYAREMLATLPADEAIILVIEAHGGSGFSADKWEDGGAYRLRSAARLNVAMSMVPPDAADASGNTVQAAWQQGENSIVRQISQAEHASEMDSLFAYWRTLVTGGSSMPITVGEMSQSHQDSEPVFAPPIAAAIADTPNRVPNTAYVTSRYIDDSADLPGSLHFTTPGYREFGRKHAQHLAIAKANVPSVAPGSSIAPVISGALTEAETLVVSNGSWTDFPTSFAYQWHLDGIAISGATSALYVLANGDVGGVIGCRVTASNSFGSGVADATGGGVVSGIPAGAFPAGIADIGSGAWYDFSDPTNVTLDVDDIETVVDLSGSGRTLTSPTATPPAYTVSEVLNGHRAAYFTSDGLTAPNLHPVFAGAAWSFTSFAEITGSSTAIILAFEGAGDNVWLGYRNTGVLRLYSSAGNSDLVASSSLAEALTWNFDGTALTIYRNGAQIGTPLVRALGGLSLNAATISGTPADSFKLTGKIGEFVAVPRALTAQEILDLHAYLTAKWAP